MQAYIMNDHLETTYMNGNSKGISHIFYSNPYHEAVKHMLFNMPFQFDYGSSVWPRQIVPSFETAWVPRHTKTIRWKRTNPSK